MLHCLAQQRPSAVSWKCCGDVNAGGELGESAAMCACMPNIIVLRP